MNYCPKCGFETKEMKFCPKCGFKLDVQETVECFEIEKAEYESLSNIDAAKNESFDRNDDINRELRIALVKSNTDRYIPVFESLDKNGGSNWNWCAFFFTPIWFAYRKLYKWSAIAFAVYFALGIIFAFISDGSAVGIIERICTFAASAVFATKADTLYRDKIDNLIKNMPENFFEREKYIEKNSGTSPLGLIITLAILAGIYVLSFIGMA